LISEEEQIDSPSIKTERINTTNIVDTMSRSANISIKKNPIPLVTIFATPTIINDLQNLHEILNTLFEKSQKKLLQQLLLLRKVKE